MMSESLMPQTSTPFICDCEPLMRTACAKEPFYHMHKGKRFCVLHYPENDKTEAFGKAFQKKVESKDFNFAGVWFPDKVLFEHFIFDREADFQWAIFNEDVHFQRATFKADVRFRRATFKENAMFGFAKFFGAVEFTRAVFEKRAQFTRAEFLRPRERRGMKHCVDADSNFLHAHFKQPASFIHATLRLADFRMSTFSGTADFRWAVLERADFAGGTFENYVRFTGPQNGAVVKNIQSLDLQFARVERPACVSFHRLFLRPEWFVNVNPRKFSFTEVTWDWGNAKVSNRTGVPAAETLGRAFRDLADNAEENHRYEEASRLRFMALNSQRKAKWHGFAFWRLSWWYWLASGYGDRGSQALLVLVGIWLISALLYSHAGFARWDPKLANESDVISAKRDDVGAPLRFSRALTYSANVMTLQKPEPRPATTAAQTVVLLETILGPVQAALLALAIRRKFMR